MASIFVAETPGHARSGQPVRTGVAVPRGLVHDVSATTVRDEEGREVRSQTRVLAKWPDGSVKWVLVDLLCSTEPGSETVYELSFTPTTGGVADHGISARTDDAGCVSIGTGVVECRICPEGPDLLEFQRRDRDQPARRLGLILTDEEGRASRGEATSVRLVEEGPVRTEVEVQGRFSASGKSADLRFKCIVSFFADMSAAQIDVDIWNPRAALHPGNCWDLGDPGSVRLKDFSVRLELQTAVSSISCVAEPGGQEHTHSHLPWRLYQDSSGGRNWDSPNHIDAQGRSTVRFPGYRITAGTGVTPLMSGSRANPEVRVTAGDGGAAVAIEDCWQNFPKAIRCDKEGLEIGLFPQECEAGFELQGGERKLHTLFVDIGSADDLDKLRFRPHVWVDPEWMSETRAIHGLHADPGSEDHEIYWRYVQSIVEGTESFLERRESIDEYGWRNFGETYADHEAINSAPERPLVSHYNNQYDFLFAAAYHYLRAGSEEWYRLMREAARHHIDIDIYHTKQDRAVYNGGLFWHTDHYEPAETATHRTYSRRNAGSGGYGGGPSNEHNYTSGFLLYYFLTGHRSGRDAVISLADWVLAMDDGERSPLAIGSSAATGKASSTVSPDYHGPGRGAGNSINALLDAYELSSERRYMAKAEELVHRCIHPRDDVETLRLGEPEYRWSYLVFLQVLGKYLRIKAEWGECDYHFFYARDSLLHYADWMVENEVPYADVLDKVEMPTETWPAQDIRKCHVMHIAAGLSEGDARSRFSERAEFFYRRCLQDLMAFSTAYLVRPRVIMAAYGYIQSYVEHLGYNGPETAHRGTHGYEFGEPEAFVPQRDRVRQDFGRRIAFVVSAIRRVGRSRFHVAWFGLRRRLGTRR